MVLHAVFGVLPGGVGVANAGAGRLVGHVIEAAGMAQEGVAALQHAVGVGLRGEALIGNAACPVSTAGADAITCVSRYPFGGLEPHQRALQARVVELLGLVGMQPCLLNQQVDGVVAAVVDHLVGQGHQIGDQL